MFFVSNLWSSSQAGRQPFLRSHPEHAQAFVKKPNADDSVVVQIHQNLQNATICYRCASRVPKTALQINELFNLVGAAGFELATPCAQGRCATRLRYAPTYL